MDTRTQKFETITGWPAVYNSVDNTVTVTLPRSFRLLFDGQRFRFAATNASLAQVETDAWAAGVAAVVAHMVASTLASDQ